MAKVFDVPAPVKLGEVDFKFSDFLAAAMDMYEPCGKGIKQIRQAVKIHDALEKLNGDKTVRFEDADFEVIKAAVENGKWVPRGARAMIAFFEAVENAQDVKV